MWRVTAWKETYSKDERSVYKSGARPTILHGSEACYPRKSKMEILQKERSMVTVLCAVKFKDRKRTEDLVLMLGLNETIVQLAMANSVYWLRHVLRKEGGHVS